MYRILDISKDSYITNKIIAGSGSFTSNVGQAGTLDLFKIYTYISSTISGDISTRELTRLLVAPNLDPLRLLTGSVLDIRDASFSVYLRLKDIYGGQTTPSNFTVVLTPLAKAWNEGRGSDIKAFRDLDAVNWITASVSNGTPTPWTGLGASTTGALGAFSIDLFVTGNLGAGSQSLELRQTFARGDEDLLLNVTSLVSATLVGLIPDYGWRIALSSSNETDDNSYFVKRFGSRHTTNPLLHPKLIIRFNEAIQDDGNFAVFGQADTIRTYRSIKGSYTNFVSGATSITGSNCAKLVMVASKSITISTSSYQQNFSASVTYNTASVIYFSQSFSASQSTIGTISKVGFYEASVNINYQTDSNLSTFLGIDKSAVFQTYWKSNDGTVLYSSGAYLTFTVPQSGDQVVSERNFVMNVTNLKNDYLQSQTARLRVFVQDMNTEQPVLRLPTPTKSLIFQTMYWRLLNAFSRQVVIPFDTSATKLSSDGTAMYFDMYMSDLDSNQVYELEFQITENDRDYFIANEGFRFKILP